VYDDLRRLAHHYMRGERPGHTLQTTALVNEVYLRLAGVDALRWQDRAHFFAMAATLMRRVLVDHARQRGREKRGAGLQVTSLADNAIAPQPSVDIVALDDVLERLAAVDPQQGRVVELRFFAGLSVEETAEVLGISPATVKRDWATAKLWLYTRLKTE
jgi:RNA polymerase sigma factor (TIGR02999 family)